MDMSKHAQVAAASPIYAEIAWRATLLYRLPPPVIWPPANAVARGSVVMFVLDVATIPLAP
jgi:hypothetical protein